MKKSKPIVYCWAIFNVFCLMILRPLQNLKNSKVPFLELIFLNFRLVFYSFFKFSFETKTKHINFDKELRNNFETNFSKL